MSPPTGSHHTHTHTDIYTQKNRKTSGCDYRTDKSTDKSKLQSWGHLLRGSIGLGLTFSNFIIFLSLFTGHTFICHTQIHLHSLVVVFALLFVCFGHLWSFPLSFMLEPQFGEMSVSTMSRQGRALCHHGADRYKHIGWTHHLNHLKGDQNKRERETAPWFQIGKHLSSISVATASVAMATGDCQASCREGWPKKSAAVTYFRREGKTELEPVCDI